MMALLGFLFFLFFSFINPFSLLAWIAALIAFNIHWEYLGLWIVSIVAVWTIILFPLNRPYADTDLNYFGELVIYSTNFALFLGMGGVVFTRLLKKHHNGSKQSAISKRGRILSFSAYGILSAYVSYLLFTDFWHNYQPAWQSYSAVFVVIFFVFITCLLFQTYNRKYIRIYWIKDLLTLGFSFAVSMIAILASNLVFPILAIKETNKVIEHHGGNDIKHCIQTDRKSMKSWLYLSPLTAWNKPNGFSGAGLRHAVLVIDNNHEYILYHWSYRLRKWEFNSVGFEPGAFIIPDSLKCKPEKNYWNNLPFVFPK